MSVGLIEIPGYVTGTWMIDPAHSDAGFVIRHLMISNIKGHFTKFEGQIVTAEDLLKSEVTATIDMTSIDTANAMRDEHLRTADFFEVEKYPGHGPCRHAGTLDRDWSPSGDGRPGAAEGRRARRGCGPGGRRAGPAADDGRHPDAAPALVPRGRASGISPGPNTARR